MLGLQSVGVYVMLVNTTVTIVGALLGIGSTNNNTASNNAGANSAASSNAAAGPGLVPPSGAQPPVGADTAAPLPPRGVAARFDISPEGLRAAQLPVPAVTAPIHRSDFGDEAAARIRAITMQARESS